MSRLNIIRAWKDPEYRLSLSEAERAMLPENPAGLIELTDTELDSVAGGANPKPVPKPRTCKQLCVCPKPTSPEKGCTVTQTYLGGCPKYF
jgi:mersacidin/lichenicidin family type 2 lantibiotic